MGLPLTYSAKKLPSGLSMHPDTGMIYGKPTKSGTFATTVMVSNGVASQTINISWTVSNRGDRVAVLPVDVVGDGLGLIGAYYPNQGLSGPIAFARIEAPAVAVGAQASVAPNFPADKWSARWEGYLEAPLTGSYGLQAVSNTSEGVRVYVDGNLVINNWALPFRAAKQVGTVALKAGVKTAIRIEYRDSNDADLLRLNWMLPGRTDYLPMPQGVFSLTP
jgi:hypothetical protein